MFVVAYSEALAHFNAAVNARDLGDAVVAASAMAARGPVSLHDALELLVLLGNAEDARFEAAARRWLVRFAREPRAGDQPPTLTEIQVAGTALAGLPDPRIARRCEGVLRALIRRVGEDADRQRS